MTRDADEPTTPLDPRPALDEVDVRRTCEHVRQRLFGVEPKPVMVGRFRIEGIAGNGAMGLVYVAYDPGLQRRIALKMIRRDRRARAGARRGLDLVREARSLAKLTHPNVVPVYEVGEIDSEVYLAMELVEGTNLRRWLASDVRTWPDVLAVFDQAAAGLEAAHAVGLVHRDFKPDNVLIGSDGRVRVADFGLASELDDPTVSAEEGPGDPQGGTHRQAGVVAGTPAYMAPEVLVGAPATAASDQYSVGISLHEALFGHRPHPLRSTTTTTSRHAVPKWVERVVQRATALDPAQRFASMAELRTALRRDPARRRRRIAAAGLVAVAIGGAYGLGSTPAPCTGARAELSSVWNRGRREQVGAAILATGVPYAARTWARIGEQLDVYADAWVQQHTEACEATSVRHEQSVEVMDRRMACLRRARLELSAVVEQLATADETTVLHADPLASDLPRPERCAQEETLTSEVPPPDDPSDGRVASLQARLAQVRTMRRAGHYAQALREVEALERDAAAVGYEPLHNEVELEACFVLDRDGRYDEAASACQRALDSALTWRQWDVARTAASTLVVVVAVHQGRPDEGMAYATTARGLLGRSPDPAAETRVRGNVASGLAAQGKYAEAEAEQRAVLSLELERLGPDDLEVAVTRNNLGAVLDAQGEFEAAEAEYRAALATRQSALGPDHPYVAIVRNNLGGALERQGKYDAAAAEFRTALATGLATAGPPTPDAAVAHNGLALVLSAQGRYAEAEQEARAAIAIDVDALGPMHTTVGALRGTLGGVLQAQGRYAESEQEDRAVYSILLAALGPEHPNVALARNNIGVALELQHDYAGALAEYRAALELRLRVLPPGHPEIGQSRTNLGNVLRALGRYDEAEKELRAALAIDVAALGPEHPIVAVSHNNLGTVLESQGKLAEAEAEYRVALELRLAALGPEHPDVANARYNVAGVLAARGEDLDEARALVEAAWSRYREIEARPERRADTSLLLAKLLWPDRGERPRALALAHDAHRLFLEAGALDYRDELDETEAWLHARGEPTGTEPKTGTE